MVNNNKEIIYDLDQEKIDKIEMHCDNTMCNIKELVEKLNNLNLKRGLKNGTENR